MDTPEKLSRTLFGREEVKLSPPIMKKREILKQMGTDIDAIIIQYKRRYKTLKYRDDIIDVITSGLNACSIAFVISSFANPILILVSGISSSIQFIINGIQNKINYKGRYNSHLLTFQQYSDLMREISTVLSKNNLSSEKYQTYIEEVNSKISLIEGFQRY